MNHGCRQSSSSHCHSSLEKDKMECSRALDCEGSSVPRGASSSGVFRRHCFIITLTGACVKSLRSIFRPSKGETVFEKDSLPCEESWCSAPHDQSRLRDSSPASFKERSPAIRNTFRNLGNTSTREEIFELGTGLGHDVCEADTLPSTPASATYQTLMTKFPAIQVPKHSSPHSSVFSSTNSQPERTAAGSGRPNVVCPFASLPPTKPIDNFEGMPSEAASDSSWIWID